MPLDADIATEVDGGYRGFATRVNPTALPPGMAQRATNIRMDRGTARTRKGYKRMADGLSSGQNPLILSFELADDLAVSSLTRSGTTATCTTSGAHGLTTGDTVNIRGAAQTDYNGDFSVVVTGGTTFTYTVSGSPASPATGTILVNAGPIVRDVYTGGVFTAAAFSDPAYENGQEYICLIGPSSFLFWKEDLTVTEVGFPTDPGGGAETVENGDRVTALQAFNRLYLFRERPSFEWKACSAATVAGTTATITCTGHGFVEGQRVRIENFGGAGLNKDFDVTNVVDANNFDVTVLSGTATEAVAPALARVKRVLAPLYVYNNNGTLTGVRSEGGAGASAGFSKLRASWGAAYINNQLAVPYERDGILFSDVLDPDTMDETLLRIDVNSGENDRVVALHPWQENRLLVFKTSAVYLIELVYQWDSTLEAITLADSTVTLLTSEVGCLSRRTVVTAGSSVLWLSEQGIYRLDQRLDLKLAGNTTPLSDGVQDLFDDLDADLAVEKSTGIYAFNRYFIAYPTTEGTDTSRVLVYNMLNQAWESIDTYGDGVSLLLTYLLANYEGNKRLFGAAKGGLLVLFEEVDGGAEDDLAATEEYVESELVTRRMGFGTLDPKNLVRTQMLLGLDAGATVRVGLTREDGDSSEDLAEYTNETGAEESLTYRARLRGRAGFAEMVVASEGGRVEVKNVLVDASLRGMSGSSRTTE